MDPIAAAVPADPPSLVELVARRALDAELAAIIWVLVESGIPMLVAAPTGRLGAGAELLRGIIGSVRPDLVGTELATALSITSARRIVRGQRPGGVLEATSLREVRDCLGGPLGLSEDEMTFLGCVLVLAPTGDRPTGPLRVEAVHYLRPLARDAHGHAQRLDPAVVATWDPGHGRYEHFAWGVLPEIAARLGRGAGDLELDLHHRRDDLAGLAAAGVTGTGEVRRLIAGYRAGYLGAHGSAGH